MSKRSVMALMLALATFDIGPTGLPRAAANNRVEAKAANMAVAKAEYSEARYTFLRQHYKANQPQADGPLSGSRLQLDAKVTRDNIVGRRSLWPVAKDVIYGNTLALKSRLDTGLSPDSTVSMGYPLNMDISLLDLAIQAGQRGVITLLLKHGVNVNPTDQIAADGMPLGPEAPLPLAASYGEDDVVRLLLQRGANINQVLRFPHLHETALDIPSRMVVLRNLLIEYGARMPVGH